MVLSLIIIILIILLLGFSNYHLDDKEKMEDKDECILMQSSNFAYKVYSSDYSQADNKWDLANSIEIEYKEVN